METQALEAAVFDLDGVVTRTARIHFAAWKRLFDELLAGRPPVAGEDHRPFELTDYRAHVDGKPRLQGIQAFLTSRGIALPLRSRADLPAAITLAALAERKNALFLELLDEQGVETDRAAVELARTLRSEGIRVGVATSSRNANHLLRRAGLQSLFEAQVDGLVDEELGLRGKPHPDALLECLRRLGGIPPQGALLIEDAMAGVEAGKAAGFGLVVGVDRGDNWLRLRTAGADWVIRELSELSVLGLRQFFDSRDQLRPNALQAWPTIASAARGKRLAVFLDYDGTLVPIAAQPELAVLSENLRQVLRRLAVAWPTQIISGRGLEDIRRLVGIDSLWMAGSHGFDIAPPKGGRGGKQIAPQAQPDVHRAADELRHKTGGIPGVLVEDKNFSIAVHYRLVEAPRVADVERAVDEVLANQPRLRKSHGKKVFQVQPALDWNKGKALLWLLEATGQRDAFPIYLGDDETDEDGFAVLLERGLGILVAELPRPTAARYMLQNPFEVQIFLERLASLRSEAPP